MPDKSTDSRVNEMAPIEPETIEAVAKKSGVDLSKVGGLGGLGALAVTVIFIAVQMGYLQTPAAAAAEKIELQKELFAIRNDLKSLNEKLDALAESNKSNLSRSDFQIWAAELARQNQTLNVPSLR
jgi:hypothetical protein